MRCPNCQKENEPTSRFCIFCGSPLLTPETGQPAEAAPEDTSPQPLPALQEEVRRGLESSLGIGARVKLVEPRSIERSEGKARRVIDRREL